MTEDNNADSLETSQEEDESPYVTYDIATYPSDLTLSVIKDMWDDGELEVPKFQRSFVWTIKQSSQLVESFLLGLPVPQVFFYIDDEHKNLIIDGQQRIRSIIYFLSGYFGDENEQGRRQVFRLTGLDDRSPYHKKTFNDLDASDQRKLKNAVLRAVNIRQLTPTKDSTSAYHIFERLNTGGTPLKPQEIRNCVFHGDIVDKLSELNRTKSWRLILGKSQPDKYQKDIELILRCFAIGYFHEHYDKPMKEFLNQIMKKNRSGKTKEFASFEKRFSDTCDSIIEKLGEKPFHIRGPINLAALDSVMGLSIRKQSLLENVTQDRFTDLLNDEDYLDSIFYNTSDKKYVDTRIEKCTKAFK